MTAWTFDRIFECRWISGRPMREIVNLLPAFRTDQYFRPNCITNRACCAFRGFSGIPLSNKRLSFFRKASDCIGIFSRREPVRKRPCRKSRIRSNLIEDCIPATPDRLHAEFFCSLNHFFCRMLRKQGRNPRAAASRKSIKYRLSWLGC